MLKILNLCKKVNYTTRSISVCKFALNEEKSQKRKVKETVELVTLVDQKDKILGLKTKVESEQLARKLNLTLERVYDTKYGKLYPAYKMFSASDVLHSEKKTSTTRTQKKLPLNCRISDHDLNLKVGIIRRWLAKNCEIHVAVLSNNESPTLMNKVFAKIKDLMKDECRILDVRNKETSIKFTVMPPKIAAKKVASNSEKNVVKSDEDN